MPLTTTTRRSIHNGRQLPNRTMSVKVMGRVWDANLKPNLKIVLLAYADAAEHDGTEIWPGWERIATMTGYSAPTVARITAELLTLGALVQVSAGHTGHRATYLIDLNHPTLRVYQDDIQSESESLSDGAESVSNDAESLSPVIPLPSSTPVLTSHPLSEAATPRTQMKNALVEAMGWNRKEVTPKQWGKVEVAAKELCGIDADPTEVGHRAQVYRVNFRGATMTPIAIASNWADLAEVRIPVSRRQVEHAAERQQQNDERVWVRQQLADIEESQ